MEEYGMLVNLHVMVLLGAAGWLLHSLTQKPMLVVVVIVVDLFLLISSLFIRTKKLHFAFSQMEPCDDDHDGEDEIFWLISFFGWALIFVFCYGAASTARRMRLMILILPTKQQK